MFKLAEKLTIKWPVTVNVPQDGGKTAEAVFEAEFDVVTQDEVDAAIEAGKDLLDRVLIGWNADLRNEAGEAIECNAESKAKLLNVTYVRTALLAAKIRVLRMAEVERHARPVRARQTALS